MIYPTIGEILILWILISIVLSILFIDFRKVLYFNFVLILAIGGCIISGFFIGIGIHILQFYLK
jgi:hypothetical protein